MLKVFEVCSEILCDSKSYFEFIRSGLFVIASFAIPNKHQILSTHFDETFCGNLVNNFDCRAFKAGFHWRRSRSWSRNQKRKVVRSSEKSNRRSRKQNTDFAYDSVPYDQVKTALSESQAEAEK